LSFVERHNFLFGEHGGIYSGVPKD
jgi:hypothetical protein